MTSTTWECAGAVASRAAHARHPAGPVMGSLPVRNPAAFSAACSLSRRRWYLHVQPLEGPIKQDRRCVCLTPTTTGSGARVRSARTATFYIRRPSSVTGDSRTCCRERAAAEHRGPAAHLLAHQLTTISAWRMKLRTRGQAGRRPGRRFELGATGRYRSGDFASCAGSGMTNCWPAIEVGHRVVYRRG